MADGLLTVETTPSFDRWMRRLKDRTAASMVTIRIRRMQVGLFGDMRDVGEHVFEMRIAYGPGYRLYGTRAGSSIIVLLCAGDKGSQARDIVKAKRMAKSFRRKR